MERRFFSIVTNKDTFFANIKNESDMIEIYKDEDGEEYIDFKHPENGSLILENVAMVVPNGANLGILLFKDLSFGSSKYVTIRCSQISSIYITKEILATEIRATISGIKIAK